MDTECLRLFVLAAEKSNISAAGKALGLAPSIASARLAKLERSLGSDLLHRSTRKVSLSQEGAEFLPYAREILSQEDAARAALGHGKPEATGTLRFTAPSTFAQLYIVPLLPEFMERHPGIRLDLRLSDVKYDLIDGSFDLALRNSAMEDTSLKGRKLADDTRILCASPDYLASHGVPTAPDELQQHQLIGFAARSVKPLMSPTGPEGVFDTRGSNARLTMDNGLSQKLATLAGAGISANSLWSVHQELTTGTLIRVLPDHIVDDPSMLWLIYPKSNVLTAIVRVFIDFLLERIGKAPPWLKP